MKQTIFKSVMAVLVALFSLNALAYDVEIDGIYYNLNKEVKTAEVTSGDNSYKGEVIIPSSFTYEGDKYSVITIKSSAFNKFGEDVYAAIFGKDVVFRSISIPKSIQKIENDAFVFCDNLTSVYIEDLTSWCNIDFGSNPLSYAGHIFLNGEEIKELVIPDNIITIKNNCFNGCFGMSSVIIPNSVTSIGDYAFSGCSGLTSLTIPNSMKSIGSSTFYECPELTDVYCYAANPPLAETDAFQDAYIEYATLHVPEVAINKYKTQVPWTQFGNIVALTEDETAIKNFVVDDVKSTKDIHAIDGKAVGKLQKGMNIIRYSDGTIKKVLVR